MGLCQSKGMFQKNRAIEFPPNSIDSSTQRNAVYKSHGTEVTAGEETPLNINFERVTLISAGVILTESKEHEGTQLGRPRHGDDIYTHISSELPAVENLTPFIKRSLPSAIGLDTMIEERREAGELKTNVVRLEIPFGKPIEDVYLGVHDGQILGSGISGVVRMVTHRATGVKYAVKSLDLGLLKTEDDLHQLREEIFIMCQLDHPNIVRLEEVYESHSEIFLVQELCLGGELFDRLDEQPDYHYGEKQCARIIKQLLSAVRYIHSKGIIHRDLKLENFLFSTTSPDSELKLIDFGLSKHFTHGQQYNDAVGTPYTVAPEVLRGSYDEKCDVWAIGVITYLLLSGDPPFGGCGGPEPPSVVRRNILTGSFVFEPKEIWEHVTPQAKHFISSLLVTNPENRPSAEDAQQSVWLQKWSNHDLEASGRNSLNPNVVDALISFKEYSDMRKLLCQVLSFTLLPNQIEDLRKEFEKFDTEGRGEITLSSLKQVLMHSAGARSLGSLSEREVEDIFNAMRIRKTDTTIQWHEFIAAGLSQCDYDDRNLRLAFDRLDSDHKGYISFDDVLDLMGSTGTEESIRAMFQDSLQLCHSKHARLSYDNFLHLMKNQTYEDVSTMKESRVVQSSLISHRRGNLHEKVGEVFSLGECTAPGGDSKVDLFLTSNIVPIHEVTGNKPALVANRELYRSHRHMRLAVMEASKRFEDNRMVRAKMKLQKEGSELLESTIVSKQYVAAGLTMRHGSLTREDSRIVRDFMVTKDRENKQKLQQAIKRAGRGRHKKDKTISDMSAMIPLLFITEPSNPDSSKGESTRNANENCSTLLHLNNNSMTWSGQRSPSLTTILSYAEPSVPIDLVDG